MQFLGSKNNLVCQTIYTAIWDFVFIAVISTPGGC
jgi:hypothetical protein